MPVSNSPQSLLLYIWPFKQYAANEKLLLPYTRHWAKVLYFSYDVLDYIILCLLLSCPVLPCSSLDEPVHPGPYTRTRTSVSVAFDHELPSKIHASSFFISRKKGTKLYSLYSIGNITFPSILYPPMKTRVSIFMVPTVKKSRWK